MTNVDPTIAMRHEDRELVCVPVNAADMTAFDQALAEYGYSVEPGGANHGDEEAEASYERFSALGTRLAFAQRGEGRSAQPRFVPHVVVAGIDSASDGNYDEPEVYGPYVSEHEARAHATEHFGDAEDPQVSWTVLPLLAVGK